MLGVKGNFICLDLDSKIGLNTSLHFLKSYYICLKISSEAFVDCINYFNLPLQRVN